MGDLAAKPEADVSKGCFLTAFSAGIRRASKQPRDRQAYFHVFVLLKLTESGSPKMKQDPDFHHCSKRKKC